MSDVRADLEQLMLAHGLDPERYLLDIGRPMEEVMASLRGPYKTILVEGGVEYSVPTESLQRGAHDRQRP
jgi:hypothetical protein